MKAREGDTERVICLADRAHDVAHGALEVRDVPVLSRDDLFPVPLVDVDGVKVIYFFVAPDGVHIGKKTLTGVKLIALERQTLPLGQRMHDLRVHADIRNVEAHRPLIPI